MECDTPPAVYDAILSKAPALPSTEPPAPVVGDEVASMGALLTWEREWRGVPDALYHYLRNLFKYDLPEGIPAYARVFKVRGSS